jgi:hypothetical protein
MPPAEIAPGALTGPACAHPVAGDSPTASRITHRIARRDMVRVYSRAFPLDNDPRRRFPEDDG